LRRSPWGRRRTVWVALAVQVVLFQIGARFLDAFAPGMRHGPGIAPRRGQFRISRTALAAVTEDELRDMSVPDLRALCRENGVKGVALKSQEQLIAAMLELGDEPEPEPAPAPSREKPSNSAKSAAKKPKAAAEKPTVVEEEEAAPRRPKGKKGKKTKPPASVVPPAAVPAGIDLKAMSVQELLDTMDKLQLTDSMDTLMNLLDTVELAMAEEEEEEEEEVPEPAAPTPAPPAPRKEAAKPPAKADDTALQAGNIALAPHEGYYYFCQVQSIKGKEATVSYFLDDSPADIPANKLVKIAQKRLIPTLIPEMVEVMDEDVFYVAKVLDYADNNENMIVEYPVPGDDENDEMEEGVDYLTRVRFKVADLKPQADAAESARPTKAEKTPKKTQVKTPKQTQAKAPKKLEWIKWSKIEVEYEPDELYDAQVLKVNPDGTADILYAEDETGEQSYEVEVPLDRLVRIVDMKAKPPSDEILKKMNIDL